MSGRPQLAGTVGMVATSHWLASASGMSALDRGGNAADAAAVAGFVLQVVTPHLHGPGGEVPILLWGAGADEALVINGQGASSRSAGIGHFHGLGLEVVPGNGLLPATVPGAFGAWTLLVERFGTWHLRQVLEYAIHYAENGYPVVPEVANQLRKNMDMLREEWTTSGSVYLPDGTVPEVGSLLRNTGLADTFRRVVAEAEASSRDRVEQFRSARRVFYDGFVAESIARFCATSQVMDTSGVRHAGLLDRADLAGFRPTIERPVTFDHGRYSVHKTPVWGQGPVMLQQLSLLAGFDLAGMDHLSAEFIHVMVECAKLAFADREAWYGDPALVDVPLADLLSDDYADGRRTLVGAESSQELRPGAPGGRRPVLPRTVSERWACREPAIDVSEGATVIAPMHGDTAYVGVVDSRGAMISATPSGGWLQGSPIIPDLGFCLGTRGQTFWLEPGLPASLIPGARPRTTLSPTLVTKDGRPYLACGTSGGDQQDQWQLAFLLTHLHHGTSLQDAIDMPRFHTAHFPNSFFPRKAKPGRVVVEDRVDPTVIAGLRERGHDVVVVDAWASGARLCAVARDPGSGLLMAAADPRGDQAYAVGR